MRKRKRILVLILSMILVFSNTMFVSAEETSTPTGTLFMIVNEYLNTDSPMKREYYIDDSSVTLYPIISDHSEYSENDYQRVIGYFLVSDSPLDNITQTVVTTPKSGNPTSKSSTKTCKETCPDYKSLGSYESYYKEYLAQFDITDENYDDFIEFSSGKYYGVLDYSTTLDKNNKTQENNLGGAYLELYPLNKDGTKYDDSSISSLRTSIVNNLKTYDFIPYLYSEKYTDDNDKPFPGSGGESSNIDSFVCYLDVTEVYYKLSLRNKCRFYWDVSKYPQFKDGFIELRGFPFDEKAHINEINDAYWFSSISLSNKKENQAFFSLGNFNDGEYIALDYYLDDYFQNLLEKFGEIVAPYNGGNYRFQLRVCDSSKSIRTNWITFDLNDVQREYTSSILDNSGNVVDDNLYDNDDFDSDFRKDGQTSDIYDTNDPDNNKLNDVTDIEIDGMKFQTWLKSAYSNVKDFASLLNAFYGWLPAELIYSIGVSIILIITLRILGR